MRTVSADVAREKLEGRTIWVWHYLHPDWQWEQSRHWHEDRYALAVAEALDIMNRDPDFCYYFDTTSEFYGAVAQRLGDRLDELKERVREGRIRLVSGEVSNTRPTQVGGAETFVRDLQLGRRYFEEHLPPTDMSLFHSVDIAIGCVQMPQILSLAGFEFYRAWRPHGPMNVLGFPHQFIWRGIDGSEILVTRGKYGYVGGPDAPPVRFADTDWDTVVSWLYENHFRDQVILDRSPTDHLWFIQGYDDARPQTISRADIPFDVIGLVNAWRENEPDTPIRWCTPLEFSRAVAAQRERLDVVEGVLDGADCGYNMGNSGAHGLWKWRQMNDRRLTTAEKWVAAAVLAGLAPEPDGMGDLWYQHCVYQAHAQDFAFQEDWNYLVDMARDVKWRVDHIQRDAIRAVVQAAGGGTRTTRLVFNEHPWPVKADVEVYHPCAAAGVESLQIVDESNKPLPQQQLAEFRHPRFGGSINDERRLVRLDLPPAGYRRIEITECSEPRARPTVGEQSAVRTETLDLLFRGHVLHEVRDRASGARYSSRGGAGWPSLWFHVLDDQNWLLEGTELDRKRFEAESSEWLQSGPLRWHHRSTGTVGPYRAWVDTVVSDDRREIDLKVRLEGHWDKPPLTGFVTLAADIEAGGSLTTDVLFAVEPRDPDNDIYVDNAPEGDELGNVSMFERTRPGVFWGRTWVDWSGDGQGVTLVTLDGNYYWLKEPGLLGHVLLRTIDLRQDTWEEYCPQSVKGAGVHEFNYALLFHSGAWRDADPQRRSLELRHPPHVARADCPSPAILPSSRHSFLQLEGPALLSAYYVERNTAFLRLYEHLGEGGEVTVTLDWEPPTAEWVDLLGRLTGGQVVLDGNSLHLSLDPWQIATLRLGSPGDRP